jgi:YihY family inner membrane protein
MRTSASGLRYVIAHPLAFAAGVLRAFRDNQGLLLAGAVAYYALLSIVPLLILCLIWLSEIVDQQALLTTLQRYLGWVIPGQSAAVLGELDRFLDHRGAIGWALLGSLVFFSSLAFSVLEKALSAIFAHRIVPRPRHFVIAAIIPYCCIVVLAAGLLLLTLLSGAIQVIGGSTVELFGRSWSLHGVSGALLYLLGIGGEAGVLTAIYLVMPAHRPSWRPAVVGAITATVLWEITRRALVWYFATLSQNSIVYGSMATAIGLLASLDIAASLLLLGAQVIAEYERVDRDSGS